MRWVFISRSRKSFYPGTCPKFDTPKNKCCTNLDLHAIIFHMDKTCELCGTTGLTWAKSVKGKWYLGTPYQHTFEDGNTVTTHVTGHNCVPTPEGLARVEARKAERQAKLDAEQAKIDAAKAEQAKLHHVEAEVGEKVTLTGVVTMATRLEGQFGTQVLLVIQTEDYQVAKMITTAEWAWMVQFDEVITVTATVKSHDIYKDIPQTKLTRPKQIVA
jgi:hypothetical protein